MGDISKPTFRQRFLKVMSQPKNIVLTLTLVTILILAVLLAVRPSPFVPSDMLDTIALEADSFVLYRGVLTRSLGKWPRGTRVRVEWQIKTGHLLFYNNDAFDDTYRVTVPAHLAVDWSHLVEEHKQPIDSWDV